MSPAARPNRVSLRAWHEALLAHFVYEARAGAVCLVLMAFQHWRLNKAESVFATPLFTPLKQVGHPTLRYIETRATLNWKADLARRLPESWVTSLPEESVLPFATPEIGRAIKLGPLHAAVAETDGRVLKLVFDMSTHRNFYASSKQATLICSGRILELIVTSLVRDPTWRDIERIQNGAPFHSAAAVASTKPVLIDNDEADVDSSLAHDDETDGSDFRMDVPLRMFLDEIAEWRRQHQLDDWVKSPWLIYCALNKVFNQSPSFNRPLSIGQQPTAERQSIVAESGLAAFNAFWAAIASFEKGPIFNLPMKLSNVNLNPDKEFEYNELFLQNIRPFIGRQHINEAFGDERVVSIARALTDHPLRKKLNHLVAALKQVEPPREKPQETTMRAREHLLAVLKLRGSLKQIRTATLVKALIAGANANGVSVRDFAKNVYDLMDQFHRGDPIMSTLERAIEELQRNN